MRMQQAHPSALVGGKAIVQFFSSSYFMCVSAAFSVPFRNGHDEMYRE